MLACSPFKAQHSEERSNYSEVCKLHVPKLFGKQVQLVPICTVTPEEWRSCGLSLVFLTTAK